MPSRRLGVLGAILLTAACTSTTVTGSGVPSGSSSAAPAGTETAASPTDRPPAALAGKPMDRCWIDGNPAWCGTLTVPEDPTAAAGRRIGLRVAVLPATGPTVRPDPVVFLAGGPGGAATEDLAWVARVHVALHRDHDFVLVDQRGTGSSNALVSPNPPDTTGQSTDEAMATLRAWVDRLLRELPGDPRFYTTSVAMDDIDAVRAALGVEQIDVIGASYGATAAQYYLRQHEAHVRTAVFDGGTLLDVPLLERVAPNSQRALDLMVARCSADAPCRSAFPDLERDIATALARVARGPVTTSVLDGSGRPIAIDALTLTGTIHTALLVDEDTAALPSLLHAAATGDWDRIAGNIRASGGGQSRLVMDQMIRCSEAWARFDPAETARLGQGSYLATLELTIARQQALSCSLIPKGVTAAGDDQPVRSDVPVLIVLGEADPQNPPANVADAPTELPNSRTVVVPGEGHTVGHLGCMPDLIAAFVTAGTTNGLDTSCVAGMTLPPFVTP